MLLRARQGNNAKLREHAIQMQTPACHALLQLGLIGPPPLLLDSAGSGQDQRLQPLELD